MNSNALLGNRFFDVLMCWVAFVVVRVNSDVMAESVRHEVVGNSFCPHFFNSAVLEHANFEQTLENGLLGDDVAILPVGAFW